MRIIAITLIAFVILLLPACGSNRSSIDMKKFKSTMQKSHKSSKDIDAARKSIFPNMKEK